MRCLVARACVVVGMSAGVACAAAPGGSVPRPSPSAAPLASPSAPGAPALAQATIEAGAASTDAATTAPAGPPPAPPVPPPVEALDPSLDGEWWTFLGASDTHAWLKALARNDPQPKYSVVVDLATSCATESYRDAPVFDELARILSSRAGDPAFDARVFAALNVPDNAAGIRKTVGLASRFGLTSVPYMPLAWNTNGPHVLAAYGLMYHSTDGGHRFVPVDDHPAEEPRVTPDGRTAVYQRCRDREAIFGQPICSAAKDLVAWPLDGSHPPVQLAELTGQRFVFVEGVSHDGHALVWRTDASHGCLSSLNVGTGREDRAVCITDPHFAKRPARGGASGGPAEPAVVEWLGMSPDERFGAVSWEGFTPFLTYETVIIDMQTSAIARTLPEWQLRGLSDDGGAVVTAWAEGGGDTAFWFAPGQPKKPLWREPMLDYDPRTRRAILDLSVGGPKRKLGPAACKLVRVARQP